MPELTPERIEEIELDWWERRAAQPPTTKQWWEAEKYIPNELLHFSDVRTHMNNLALLEQCEVKFFHKYRPPVDRTPNPACPCCVSGQRHTQYYKESYHPDAGTGQNKDRRMAGG